MAARRKKKARDPHAWLPKPFVGMKPNSESGVTPLVDGEPLHIPMEHFRNDRTLRGSYYLDCCDCGLRHLFTFAVTKVNEKFWLVLRPYADRLASDSLYKRRRGRLKLRGKA